MGPTEDAERESCALLLETIQVRLEREEGEKIIDPPSGRDGEILPKVGLMGINIHLSGCFLRSLVKEECPVGVPA